MKIQKIALSLMICWAPLALIASAQAGTTGGAQAKVAQAQSIEKALVSWLNLKQGCVNAAPVKDAIEQVRVPILSSITSYGVMNQNFGPIGGLDQLLAVADQEHNTFLGHRYEAQFKPLIDQIGRELLVARNLTGGDYASQSKLESQLSSAVSGLGSVLGATRTLAAQANQCLKEVPGSNVSARQACQKALDGINKILGQGNAIYAKLLSAKHSADCVESDHQIRFWACQARQLGPTAPAAEPSTGMGADAADAGAFDRSACLSIHDVESRVTDPMDYSTRAMTRLKLWTPIERMILAKVAADSLDKKGPVTHESQRKMAVNVNRLMSVLAETDEAHGCKGVPAEDAPAIATTASDESGAPAIVTTF